MARAFSIARALTFDKPERVIEGYLTSDGEFISTAGGEVVFINKKTLCFNTGIIDGDGDEMFTGDKLYRDDADDIYGVVVWEPEEGAFFVRRPCETERTVTAKGFARGTVIHFERLTQKLADDLHIWGCCADAESI